LPAKTFDFANCNTLNANFRQGFANIIELERLYDGGNHFHCINPLEKNIDIAEIVPTTFK